MAKSCCAKVRIRREAHDGLVHLTSGAEDVPLTEMNARRFQFESGATLLFKFSRRGDRLTAFIDAGDGVEIVAPNGNSSMMWFRVEFSFFQGRMRDVKLVPGPKSEESRDRYKRFREIVQEEEANQGFIDAEFRTA
ncbi:MAG: hypothetical protein RL417_1442 [Pseudomonadota bacterium]|jgi:hypothetical protein